MAFLASACAAIAGITDITGVDGGHEGGDSSVGSSSGASGGSGGPNDGSSGASGSSGGPNDSSSGASGSSGSPNDSSSGSSGSSSGPNDGSSASGSGAGGSSGGSSGDSGGSSSDSPNTSTSSGGSSGTSLDSGSDGDSSSGTGCLKGQVTNNEVVMIGDSYMDTGNVGPTIMKDANNAAYRHYYLAGAALNYGAGNLNIPYQFDTTALMDSTVTNPADIKVVIMDGGVNDILIDNTQCLTTPIGSDTGNTCHNVVDSMVARGTMLEKDIASHGVQAIIHYFIPDLDSTVSGHQNVNDWLDYAYPKAAVSCCGAANVPASGDLSCHGSGPGASVDCIWIDTRPEFVGHSDHTNAATYWFQSDNVHPTQSGADAIAAKVWAAMQKYCIAQ